MNEDIEHIIDNLRLAKYDVKDIVSFIIVNLTTAPERDSKILLMKSKEILDNVIEEQKTVDIMF